MRWLSLVAASVALCIAALLAAAMARRIPARFNLSSRS